MICPGVKVLVVDDEPMNLMVAEGIFKDFRMEITTAESGMKAISLCEQEEFDLIFLDHMMPEMDGVETLKHIRQIHKETEQGFTIIAFTANAVSGAREMFLQKGFDEFISKPIEMNELERVLKKVLPKSSIQYEDSIVSKKEEKDKKEESVVTEEKHTEAELQNGNSQEEMLERLRDIGMNIENAIQYSQGDVEFFFQLLQEYINVYELKMNEMESFFQKEDFENYRIQVHALKSSSKLVGVDSLSEMARSMEEATVHRDIAYMQENHKELLNKYGKAVRQIAEVLETDEKSSGQTLVEISRDKLSEQLEQLKESLVTYEIDEAENLISELERMKYEGEMVKNLLSDIRQDVEDFEFAVATEKTASLLSSLKEGDKV